MYSGESNKPYQGGHTGSEDQAHQVPQKQCQNEEVHQPTVFCHGMFRSIPEAPQDTEDTSQKNWQEDGKLQKHHILLVRLLLQLGPQKHINITQKLLLGFQ